jgi:hypothetical protein
MSVPASGSAMRLPRRPTAVVVDMDGLLFDSEKLYQEAILLAAAEGIGFYGGAHCFAGHEQHLVAAGAAAVFDAMSDLKRLITVS